MILNFEFWQNCCPDSENLTLSKCFTTYGPRQANLVLIAYASSEDSDEHSDRKPDPWPL